MAGDVFDFCPGYFTVETLAPDQQGGQMNFNGWPFSARPNIPYLRRWKLTLYGLTWYLQPSGLYDNTTNTTFNARCLEEFYQAKGLWADFDWTHPHLGLLRVRFASVANVPASEVNSGGLVAPVEIILVHHNPGF